jgi:hypothetical protein
MPLLERPQSYVVALFTSGVQWGSLSRAVERVQTIFGDLHVYPMPTTVPPDAPAELPRIALLSTDQRLQVILSLVRMDFRYFPPSSPEQGSAAIDFERFCSIAEDKLSALASSFELEVNRIAGVCEHVGRTTPEEGWAVEYLRRRFFVPDLPIAQREGRLWEAQVQLNNRSPWRTSQGREVVVNNIAQVTALHPAQDPSNHFVLVVKADVNTIPDDPSIRYSASEVSQFCRYITERLPAILRSAAGVET